LIEANGLQVYEGSHWVPLDQPDRLNRLLLEFLR
jgi:pimeloyl-ACP methyl ester carboxylesterase